MAKQEYLMDYLFHYNPYTQLWSCFKRDNSPLYFNQGIAEFTDKSKSALTKQLKNKFSKNN